MVEFRERYRYTVLLATLILLLLAAPILVNLVENQFLLLLLIYLPYMTALYSISDYIKHSYVVLMLISLVVITEITMNFYFMGEIFIMNQIFMMGIYGYLSSLIIRDLFVESKKVTIDMISGVLSVYMFIGLLFANMYGLIQFIDNDAFMGVKFIESDPMKWTIGFIYFSFVTLTTLGYGDISPNTVEAGSFVYFEAIVGQAYLTVFVARLVGIHISQSRYR